MPAHRPGRKRHELEPLTRLHHRRGSLPSAAGLLRAVEAADFNRTGRKAQNIRPSTAASQPARTSRTLAPSRSLTSNAPNAFIGPQRARRDRQIPIGQNLRSSSRGFVPWRLSDAGPGASGCVCASRHPKPFTGAELGGWPWLGLLSAFYDVRPCRPGACKPPLVHRDQLSRRSVAA
jgi:hypothetical protein